MNEIRFVEFTVLLFSQPLRLLSQFGYRESRNLTLWGYTIPFGIDISPVFWRYIMTQSNQNYFNLTVDGIGFLNRPREVQGKRKSSNYYACTIQASRGDAGEKTRFDLRIVGDKAKELFARLLEEFPQLQSKNIQERPTVVVGFRAGDIQPLKFEAINHKTGEVSELLSIDGRLLKFKFIKVDGDMWYQSSYQGDQNQDNPDA